MTIKNLLKEKGRHVWTIDPDATVFDAMAKMAEKDIGSLIVMDGGKLIGIIAARRAQHIAIDVAGGLRKVARRVVSRRANL